MLGLGGMLGAFTGLAFLMGINTVYHIIFIILVAGITGTSRLILKAHNPIEIYTGFLLGSIGMTLIFLI